MMKRFLIPALVALSVAATHAFAAVPVAQVGKTSGKVLVNQGKGFVALVEGSALFAGDKVFVGKDATASISYSAANCTVDVAPASVMQVQATAPCAAGETVSSINSVFVHSAQGMGAGSSAGAQYVPIVVTGSLVTLGGAVVLMLTQDDKPVSTP